MTSWCKLKSAKLGLIRSVTKMLVTASKSRMWSKRVIRKKGATRHTSKASIPIIVMSLTDNGKRCTKISSRPGN